MFVRHSVHVDRRFEDCAASLRESPDTWFPGVLRRTQQGEGRRLAAVGFPVVGLQVRKKVQVEIGKASSDRSEVVVSFSWRPTFPSGAFPDFDGNLELAPVEPGVSRLTVSGTYSPPLAGFGQQLDEMLLHRVAEATVRELAEAVRRRLEQAAPAPATR